MWWFPAGSTGMEECNGGREKAPAAMCREIAAIVDGGAFEVWGDGTAMQVFTSVDDQADGIQKLMQSDLAEPTSIRSDKRVSVNEPVPSWPTWRARR